MGETSLFKTNVSLMPILLAYVMDKAVSIDIDEAQDLQVAKVYMEAKEI